MSMPDETPAAVTYLPSVTTRSPVGSTPKFFRWSRASQWEVARRPSRSPAAASSSEPVHTDVVQVLVASAARSQSRSTSLSICGVWPGPPGTTTMSGVGTSARVLSAVMARLPVSVRTGPACSATKTVSESGRRPRVS
jgi:hypothetical protein